MRRALVAIAVLVLAGVAGPGAAPAKRAHFAYDVPVLAGSPWPEMRRDGRNTASSPIRGRYRGDEPWSFRTGRGIFSTPVIGDDGLVYVGSADGFFYALGPDGRPAWRFRTGGIIDAAAALGRRHGRRGGFPITIGSGDETLYQLRSAERRLPRRERVRWRYRTALAPATGQLVNWWEGNVAYGPDGNLFVGNTGGGAYSLTAGGEQRWVVQRANSVWTTPAFDERGNSYWGSVDLFAFSLDLNGALRWQVPFAGYVTSSPALGSDGTVYVGAFDRALHALDPDTGAERWSFPTAEHIYGSPALAHDREGATSAIYIGSADGSVSAVRPDGSQIWSYETGDPVRSSPALGRAPRGDGEIVYVGSSNGRLYALDAETGARRWSFDTTPEGAALADRNDLNGSPALGRRGVYIGGEHGRVWFVPYDYCRRVRDPRCERAPGEEFAADSERVLPVTPGGTTRGAPTSGSRRRPCSRPGSSSARAGARSTPGCSASRAPMPWSAPSRPSTSRPSSPAMATISSSAPTASSSPRGPIGCGCGGAGTRSAVATRPAASTACCAFAASARAAASCRSPSGAGASGRSSSAVLRCRCPRCCRA